MSLLNKLKFLLLALILTTVSYAALAQPVSIVRAIDCTQPEGEAETVDWGTPESLTQDPACLSDPSQARELIGPMLNWGLTLLMIAAALSAFVMLIWGSYKYISAQGDAAKAAEGRKTIQYAVAGLVILAAVYLGIVFYNTLVSGTAGT